MPVDDRTLVTEDLQDFFVDLKDKLLQLFVRKDPSERGYYSMIWDDLKMDQVLSYVMKGIYPTVEGSESPDEGLTVSDLILNLL